MEDREIQFKKHAATMTQIIKVHNDEKEKHQSFEAWCPNTDMVVERGYGRDEQEAIEDYKQKLSATCKKAQDINQAISQNRYKKISVNWQGDLIKGGA